MVNTALSMDKCPNRVGDWNLWSQVQKVMTEPSPPQKKKCAFNFSVKIYMWNHIWTMQADMISYLADFDTLTLLSKGKCCWLEWKELFKSFFVVVVARFVHSHFCLVYCTLWTLIHWFVSTVFNSASTRYMPFTKKHQRCILFKSAYKFELMDSFWFYLFALEISLK